MVTDNRSQADRWHIHVRPRKQSLDGHGRDVLADAHRLGLTHIERVSTSRIYFLEGTLDEHAVHLLARELFTDAVVETSLPAPGFSKRQADHPSIEVHKLPGVMDSVALTALEAGTRLLHAEGLGTAKLSVVRTARRYEVVGAHGADDLDRIASQLLANDCIERWYIQGLDRNDLIPEAFPDAPVRPFALRHVAVRELDDQALTLLSREAHLFLSLEEMRTIRDHFDSLGRDPTDLELETLAQTWSEHCVHKTLKSTIDYRGEDFGKPGRIERHYDNLLGDTIVAATKKLNRDWCLSVFVDNAGVIAFDDEYGIAFKAETHNHPSAIEPYGGAATGIGGCIRDIMGCGLGAKPIASTNVFCLAPPDFDDARLPKDVLHPRRTLRGVVRGVRDYGNRMGIPTVNGAIYFDDRYVANPLVFCGCVGLIPRDKIEKEPKTGDYIVVVGGRTGRDGIHGATFSSAELTDTHASEFSHAVQIGNALEEKKVLDAQLLARDHEDGCLYSSVTDCGAGGLSSAVGEMAEMLGAEVELNRVPLKYAGLRYDEIWISEAQERMVFSVPPDRLDRFCAVFAAEDVEAVVIGTFSDDRILRVRYDNQLVGELDMAFLHDGLPTTVRKATWSPPKNAQPPAKPARLDNHRLLAALGELNTASKEWVIRQYDHEVQGRSVVKPLAGPGEGPSDGAVLRPRYDSDKGIALACGLCPERTERDPYWMAVAAIDEAFRNVICVGGNPDHTAILDNFCWPKVDTEESLGSLVQTCQGAHDAALAYGLPFVSGKDSLNNEFSMSAEEAERTGLPQQIAIPGTLLITAVSVIDDVNRCVTPDLKEPGNRLVLASAPVESVGLETALALHRQVAALIADGKVRAAHDVSDGGLAVTVAEMCFAGRLGATLSPGDEVDPQMLLDSVSTTYVLEMNDADARAAGLPIIGTVESEPRLRIDAGDGVDVAIDELAEAWREPLAQGGGR